MGVQMKVELSNDAAFMSGQPTALFFKVTLVGVEEEGAPAAYAVPPAVVLLIDTSGSMAGEKIEAAKAAAKAVLDILPDRSYLSLYTFAHRVELVCNVASLSDETRAQMKSQIDRIEAGGMTNMYDALKRALDEMRLQARYERPLRVFLLTDGFPTTGVLDEGEFYKLGAELGKCGVELVIFGIGDEYNEDLLEGILKHCGKGALEHITSPVQIPELLSKYARKASRVAARNVTLCIQKLPQDKVEVFTELPSKADADKVSVNVGDIAADEVRKIYGKLIIAPRGVKGSYRIATFTVLSGAQVLESKDIIVEFTDDIELVKQRSRPEIAWEAMGLEALRRGDLAAVKRTISAIKDEALRRTLTLAAQAAERGDRKTLKSLMSKTLRGSVEG